MKKITKMISQILFLSIIPLTAFSASDEFKLIEFTDFLKTEDILFKANEKIVFYIDTNKNINNLEFKWLSSIGDNPKPLEINNSKALWIAPDEKGEYRVSVTVSDKTIDLRKTKFFKVKVAEKEAQIIAASN
ncbi:MAG: hypothetical protein ABIA04_15630 [Pseudomonadota bacterium]